MKTVKNLLTKELTSGQFGCVAIQEFGGLYSCSACVTDRVGNINDAWYDVEDALRIDGEGVTFATQSGAEGWFADHALAIANASH